MNLRYIRLGCAILVALMKSPDGRRYLSVEDLLLPQLAECFNQLDPVCHTSWPYLRFGLNHPQFGGRPSPEPLFSAKNLEDTLTSGYFEMIGTMSKYPEGIE